MSRKDWLAVVAMILGALLFLYGANYYNDAIGWIGVFLSIGGVVALVLLYVYNSIKKPHLRIQKP